MAFRGETGATVTPPFSAAKNNSPRAPPATESACFMMIFDYRTYEWRITADKDEKCPHRRHARGPTAANMPFSH